MIQIRPIRMFNNLFSSPIHTIPVEIWEEIFLHALDPPSHFKSAGFNATEFFQFDPKSVLRLSQISRYIRQIVISCPILWTRLPSLTDLYPRAAGRAVPVQYFQRHNFKLIQLFQERAQNLPLHVTFIDVQDLHWTMLDIDSAGLDVAPSIPAFFATSHRWKSLIIYFMAAGVLLPFSNDIKSRSSVNPPLPLLDSLTIQHAKASMTYLPTPINVFMSAPQLQHVDFTGMDVDALFLLPWNKIKSYSGAVRGFSDIGATANVVQNLHLKRNFQHFGNPTDPTPFNFTKLTKLTFENINCRYKIPKFFGDWRNDGTVLRWIEAPLLRQLVIDNYQALPQAPSLVHDLTSSMLRLPHNNLIHITFHVGGLTRQSLADLLHSTPNLETLDLWGSLSEAVPALKANIWEDGSQIQGVILAPNLRRLVVREWQESSAQSLLEVFDSRRSDLAALKGVTPLESISLVYQKYAACRKAQDDVEGWSDEREKVYKPGTEYHKIHGFSTHLAKEFLVNDSKRNPLHYGVRRPSRGVLDKSDPQKFLEVVRNHEYTDLSLVEMSRLRMILQDIQDQIKEQGRNEQLLEVPGSAHTKLLSQTADALLQQRAPYFCEVDMNRRWKLMEDRLTLKLSD